MIPDTFSGATSIHAEQENSGHNTCIGSCNRVPIFVSFLFVTHQQGHLHLDHEAVAVTT